MPGKKSGEEHLKCLELDQVATRGLGKAKDILKPAMDKVSDNMYAYIPEEPELNSISYDKSEIDQIRSVCVTFSPC